jgi:hypothetical protein
MKLAVLGGTSIKRQRFVKRALLHGYSVTMLIDPTVKSLAPHDNLTLIRGFIKNKADITHVIQGSHAVIGITDKVFSVATLSTIISCMYANNIRRLIVFSDHLEQLVTGSSDYATLSRTSLDWTIVYAPLLQSPNLTVSDTDFAKFMLNEITNVTHLQRAVVLRS